MKQYSKRFLEEPEFVKRNIEKNPSYQPIFFYDINEEEVRPYRIMVREQKDLSNHLEKGFTFLGYGYWVGTTLENKVSAETEVCAFFA